MSDEELYRKAEKRVDEKIGFYRHLYSFITVNVILIIINVITNFQNPPGEWWFYWVTIFWGIGLLIHYIKTFVITGKLEDNRDEMIQKEMEKMKK